MTVELSTASEYVALPGIAPEQFQAIVGLLGDCHPRLAYDGSTLEMRRVLVAVPPDAYWRLMEVLPEQRLWHTYDGWTLEMMTPRRDHEWYRRMIGRMLETMAFALDIPIQSTGSTTLSTSKHDRGVQPDETYYVGEKFRHWGQETYTPGVDPPPDLAIEIEVTHPLLPRLSIFAQIGVMEIWRYKDDAVEFLRLAPEGQYEAVQRSAVFSFITPADITRFLQMRQKLGENELVRAFVDWAKTAQQAHGPQT